MFLLVAFVFFVLGPVFSQAQCGQRPGARIVGGSTATPNSWPWQLSLRVKNYHSCGASLINPRWAITAAHCVENENDPHMYTLVAGAHHIEKDGVVYRVNRIIMHAGYSNSHFRNDVALLRLAVPVKLDRKDLREESRSRLKLGGARSNYGLHWRKGGAWDVTEIDKWKQGYSITGWSVPKLPKITYKYPSSMPTPCLSTCGGPLVCEEGGRWVLRGIASWTGSKKCHTDNYTMYARVSNFINWINQQIANAGDGDYDGAQCGQRPGVRIVGGSTATPNSWPWQLSLRVRNGHTCGASLINPKWAITAAHCVRSINDPHEYSLVAGAHHIQRDGVVYRINKIIMHAGFSMSHLRDDIALLRLAVPVKLDRNVGTVCFPKSGSRVSPGTRCWISGWGTEGFNIWGTAKSPEFLQQANVPVVDSRTCAQKAGSRVHDATMVCIGGKGQVACHGDRYCNRFSLNESCISDIIRRIRSMVDAFSAQRIYQTIIMPIFTYCGYNSLGCGGPLVCEEGGRWVLRGVASWAGHKKCHTDNYTMYARVSNYINWINQQIASM
ncbi:transmembrane protease serine 9-like [Oculina patagonica]